MNEQARSGFSGKQVFVIVLIVMLATALVTFFIARHYLFLSEFKPVELSAKEEQVLESKLQRLRGEVPPAADAKQEESDQEWLRPEAYAEDPARRKVSLSERELNGLLARDETLARRIAIDLSNDLASARVLIPVDPDFPILGGKTIRVSAGLELAFREGRPVVAVRGSELDGCPRSQCLAWQY